MIGINKKTLSCLAGLSLMSGASIAAYNTNFTKPNNDTFAIIAHRGGGGSAPENTMAAFKKSHSIGVDILELDVHRTKDQALVIMHDETVDRTTNGTGKIKDLTLQEIKFLDAGSKFSKEYKGEQVPTLNEVLDWAKGKTKLNIDIKDLTSYPGIDKDVANLIKEKGAENEVVFSSFDRETIKQLKILAPNIPAGQNISRKNLIKAAKISVPLTIGIGLGISAAVTGMGWLTKPILYGIIASSTIFGLCSTVEIGKKIALKDSLNQGMDFIQPFWGYTSKKWINQAHEKGIKVYPWAVNNNILKSWLKWQGADGMITDYPSKFISNTSKQ